MDTIVQQIAHNSPSLTELVLDDVPMEYFKQVSELTNAFKLNDTIVSVRFEKDFLSCLHSEKDSVIEALSKLKSLKSVQIGDTTVQVLTISKLLDNCKTLRSLKLENVVFQGIQTDFNALELSLYKHNDLKSFDLGHYCCALGDEIIMDGIKALNHDPDLSVKLQAARQNNPAAFAA